MRRFIVLGLPLVVFLLTVGGSVGKEGTKNDTLANSTTALEPWASKA